MTTSGNNGGDKSPRVNRFKELAQPASPAAPSFAQQQSLTSQPQTATDFNTLFYFMIWGMLSGDDDYSTPEGFQKGLEEYMPGFDINDPANAELKPLLEIFEAFMTGASRFEQGTPQHAAAEELRQKPAGQVADTLTRNLPIAPEVRSRPDPKFAEAQRQAAAYGDRALPADPAAWNLTDKIVYAQRMAKEQKLDGDLLVAQIRQESGFRNKATSYVGAGGIAQMMPGTWIQVINKHGSKLGLGDYAALIDDETLSVSDPSVRKQILDLRMNPQIALRAMSMHMKDLTEKTGSQKAALFAYNGGEGAIEDIREGLGKKPGQQVTFEEGLSRWGRQRAEIGIGSIEKYRHQTYDYGVAIVASAERIAQTREAAEATLASAAPRTPVTIVAAASTLTPPGAGGS
jgi:soluble lytic murein transglycosylase-like protein